MSAPASGFYSRAAMRQARENREAHECAAAPGVLTLDQIPVDAPYDDAVVTAWRDGLWKACDRSVASLLVVDEGAAQAEIDVDATCVVGDCAARVWLVREGERWLMFAGSPGPKGRRRDFASPYLGHAIRTAEQWYGAPRDGWQVERRQATRADSAPQDAAHD